MGAGFLVDSDIVCTCAHVVAAAAGLQTTPDEAPRATVSIDFPLMKDDSGTVSSGRAVVVAWQPIRDDDTGDVALLRLERRVPGSRPVPLVDGTRVWDHTFRVLGFPEGAWHGVWASGTLRGTQGAGWLQMETSGQGQRVSAGFSGSPVWDDAQSGVVGMTVAVQGGAGSTTGYLIPSASLVDESVLRPRCPFRGLAPFTADEAGLFHAREEETARLETAVGRQPLTLVVGPSGCGKSSLVRAGLVPRLMRRGWTGSELRAVPGASPARIVARALVPVLQPSLTETERLRATEELSGLLTRSRSGAQEPADEAPAPAEVADTLVDLRSRVLAQAGRGGHVLFVDQLEEYAAAEPAAARELLQLLIALGTGPQPQPHPDPALRVVATARPESLDTLVTFVTADSLSAGAVQFLAPLSTAGLRLAVTAPVEAVPGLWYEAGLPERIVADAADQPGRMPLVEFALQRLWERREGSMLTHTAYDELGGVAGALVGYAEDTIAGQLETDGEFLVKRLFAQLTRPDDSGGFARSPARLSELDPALRSLARRLAPAKLVVLDRAPDGEEIADLAHEALAALWPRLNNWLVDARDFRQWQEHLRHDMRRWREEGEEDEALLRGGVLATASDWLGQRPQDLTEPERTYIRRSVQYHRRGVRRLRALVAGLTALVLLAAGLAFGAWQSNRRAETQLRTQASRLLASISDRHSANDPSLSVQLGLAAWRTEPTPESYAALLRQYARGQQLSGSHPGLWPGTFTGMRSTRDGTVTVVRSRQDDGAPAVTLIEGLAQGAPRGHALAGVPDEEPGGWGLSPDGRSYAQSDAEGGVRVWDLTDPGAKPRYLASDDAAGRKVNGAPLDFSSDGSRLLRMLRFYDASGAEKPHQRHAALSVWDVVTGRRLPTAPDLVPDGPRQVAFTEDPGQVVFTPEYSPSDGRRTVIRDLATGRQVRAFAARPLTALAGNGELLVEEGADIRGKLHVRAVGPSGRVTTDLPSTAMSRRTADDLVDATGEFAVYDQYVEKGAYAEFTLIGLRTGEVYRTRAPADGSYDELSFANVVVIPSADKDKHVTLVLNTPDALLTTRAEPLHATAASLVGEDDTTERGAVSPDGKYVAFVKDRSLTVVETTSGAFQEVPWDTGSGTNPSPVWTADARWIVLGHPDGRLTAVAAHHPRTRTELTWEDARPPARRKGVEAVEPVRDGEVAVMTTDARVMLLDAATGRRIGPAIQVERRTEGQTSNPFAPYGQLRSRPDHPDEIAVVTSSGTETGTVEIWNLRTGTLLRSLATGRLQARFETTSPTPLLFTSDGRHLTTRNADEFLHRWDVDSGKETGRPLPAAGTQITELLGFGPRDTLITRGGSVPDEVQWWDLESGLLLTSHPVAIPLGMFVRGHHLVIAGRSWYQDLDLRPDSMADTLCSGVPRDFTAKERALLPPGSEQSAPC
ncbi:trypsin-like peptidase domain-containing protein [Streptomyces sp. NPDC006183]|uniref:nSTAND1 domain-containing NTPase n=2 Tax=unclassified Streptomyces TaxID=2593676 RepID=UPI0033B12A67